MPLAVHEIDECGAALIAPRHHAAGHAVGAIGLLARLEIVDDVGSRDHALELMRKGVDALLAQARELGPAIVDARPGAESSTRREATAGARGRSARSW